MDKPIKVLYFVDRMLRGGIQSLVIDWVSRFDKEKIHVDFLLLDDGNEYELEKTLKEIGCKVYKLKGIWIKNPFDYIKYSIALNNFFEKHHDYKVVHLHSSSKNYMILKYAKKYKIPVRIAHSHTIDFQTKNPLKKIVGNFLKPKIIKYSTDYFACSKIAGEWLFGKKIVTSSKFKVIHNAINYDNFKFNIDNRKKYREKLNISDSEIVIGHIGRFVTPKNHNFLINVFSDLYKINDKYKLLLVGTGALENKIKRKVKLLKLENAVIFAGFQSNVNKYLQAMDVFAFPSKYEGLGLALVEAQTSGIPCLASNKNIPTEVKIMKNFHFLPLQKKLWINTILNMDKTRLDSRNELKAKKYLIEDVVLELEKIYMSERIS